MTRRHGVVAALVLLYAGAAVAEPCGNRSGLAPCLDSDSLWLAAAPSLFSQLGPATSLAFGHSATSFVVGYARSPLTLRAQSADPEGRSIEVVKSTVNASLLWAAGLGRGWDFSVALELALARSGAGFQGVTAQAGPPLTPNAARDPRLVVGRELFTRAVGRVAQFRGKAECALTLPLGDERALAGEPLPVVAPRLLLELEAGRWYAGSELGVRLRGAERVGSANWGSQGLVALGLGVRLTSDERLSFGIESWLAPVLVAQTLTPEQQVALGSTRLSDAVLLPAEWLATLRAKIASAAKISLSFGTGLPLSSQRLQLGDAPEEQQHFAGMTTPRWRALLSLELRARE